MSELRPYDDSRVAGGTVTKWMTGVLSATDGTISAPTAAYQAGYGVIQEDGSAGDGVGVCHNGITFYLAGAAHSAGEFVGVVDTSGRLGRVPAGKPYCMLALKTVTAAGDLGLGFVTHGYMSKDIRSINTAKTADFSISAIFPEAGTYLLKNIIIVETEGNAVTGGVDIGTTDGGAEVVSAEAVSGSAEVNCTLVKSVFVASAAVTFYVTAHTAWNDASINVYIVAERLA